MNIHEMHETLKYMTYIRNARNLGMIWNNIKNGCSSTLKYCSSYFPRKIPCSSCSKKCLISSYFFSWMKIFQKGSLVFYKLLHNIVFTVSYQKQSTNVILDKWRLNPLMPSGSFNICCPRDTVSRTANEKLVTIVANGH